MKALQSNIEKSDWEKLNSLRDVLRWDHKNVSGTIRLIKHFLKEIRQIIEKIEIIRLPDIKPYSELGREFGYHWAMHLDKELEANISNTFEEGRINSFDSKSMARRRGELPVDLRNLQGLDMDVQKLAEARNLCFARQTRVDKDCYAPAGKYRGKRLYIIVCVNKSPKMILTETFRGLQAVHRVPPG